MAVTNIQQIFTSTVSPTRLFKALVTDYHVVFPKAVPGTYKSVEIVEGDGGAGTIRLTNLDDGKFLKHRIDVVDVENLYFKGALIGGNVGSEKVELVVSERKIEAAPGGGCVFKVTSEYHVKAGYELTVEEVEKVKESTGKLFKAVEDYLLAHPEECA